MRIENQLGLCKIWLLRLMLTCSCLATLSSHAVEIEMVRYVEKFQGSMQQQTLQQNFFGVPGVARLILSGTSVGQDVQIELNDITLDSSGIGALAESAEFSVELLETNTINVELSATSSAEFSIRVEQVADIEHHVHTRVHFNTNVSDFEAARAFYVNIGFDTLSGFPDTNTQAMARAIGVETPTEYDGSQGDWAGGYLLHGELIGVSGYSGGLIDLIEFTIPRSDEAPYASVNHLGMARAAMYTTDIELDYAYMLTKGVEFLAAPTARVSGDRFAIFKDLDGTFYELIEFSDTDPDLHEETETTHIYSLGHITINVSDFDRSLAWYRMLGYEVAEEVPGTESEDVALAMGLAGSYEIKGAMLSHPEDGSKLELVQWLTPYNADPPYPLPVNHLGIHRTAFSTSDMAADVAMLKSQGVEFVSDVTPCCSGPDAWGSIVAFYDPDGVVVELVEQPLMDPIIRFLRWVTNLFS